MKSLTWKCFEVINQVNVVTVWVRGHEVELLLELLIQSVALVHHPDHKPLDVARLSFFHSTLQADRVPLISLSVCDDDGHLPHTCSRCLEQLVGLLDRAASESALAQVCHGAHSRLDLITSGFLSETDHHHVHVAVEDHTHPRGVPADRGSVDDGVHKVLDHVEVVGADALRAVDHEDELQGGLAACHSTTCGNREADLGNTKTDRLY